MSFNYSKNNGHNAQDSFWTSYSDLFLGLSTIFLMLYVTASLRTGTEGLRNQIENKKLTMKVDELEHQLKMYESVKNDFIMNKAPKEEVQEYNELMDKLTLLQEDTKNEKDKLVQQVLDNDKKVKALNKYQQMVRNVLNANKMAQSKIVNREDLIQEQDFAIEKQDSKISTLNSEIANKQKLIAQGEERIKNTEQALSERMNQLRSEFKKNKLSKELFDKKMAQEKAESEKRVGQLSQENAQYQAQLQAASSTLGKVQGELSKTQGTLSQKESEAARLAGALAKNRADSQARLAAMEAGLAAEKNLGAQKVDELKGQLSDTQGQLAKARSEIDARKSVANNIQKGFAKAGIKADIDMQSGDVVLDFGQNYFENGSDQLKLAMKNVIEKAMPVYSKSLFGNPKVSNKISAVEIIGFASPTYQGRFIDPQSNRDEDKEALKYNMDLSYRRANSIFSYMLDKQSGQFDHQRELLSLMKVSGRSFLEVMKVKDKSAASAADFCKKIDCNKARRVIIRFSMDQKK